MKCICKIMDVEMGKYSNQTKKKAELSIKSGESLFSVNIWENQVNEGLHEKAKKIIGQETMLEITVDVYRNNPNFSLGFNNEFLPYINKPQPVQKVANG